MSQGSTNYTHLAKLSIDTALAFGKDEAETDIMDGSGNLTFPGKEIISNQALTTSGNIIALDSSKGFIRLNPTAATNIKGIAAGVTGQQLEIYNASTNAVTFTAASTAALAVNRITLMTTAASVVTTGSGYACLIYSTTDSAWLLKYLTI